MATPFIIDAVRTPMGRGRPNGALAQIHPVELLAETLKAIVARTRIDPGLVDDVLTGCVSQCGEQYNNIGRMALLAAGFPTHVPATTIERKCGSSQQAVHFAAQGIASGAYDLVIACGIESMSRIPLGSARMGKDIFGPTLNAAYAPGFVSQGVSAELIAAKWGISREEMDLYSAESHRRADAVRTSGGFADEIHAVKTDDGIVAQDETIRPGTTAEALAALQPSFVDEELSRRYPQISWIVTAGNSSQITDGASAMLLASEAAAEKLGLKPRARFVAFDVVGDDPLMMLTAPIPATRRVLSKANMAIEDIDHVEVNEAFASVPLAWAREFPIDRAKLNPRGGAIALGHPLGATGAIRTATLVHGLQRTGGKYGMVSMCIGTGMGAAGIFERL